MSFSPLDSAVFGSLFVDPHVAAFFSDHAALEAMVRVEAALARAEGRVGAIPGDAAAELAAWLDAFDVGTLDLPRLAERTVRDGVPVAGLVAQLRERLAADGLEDTATWLHWGATTQDVMDTGLVLRLRDAVATTARALERVLAHLAELAERHRDAPTIARTHGRQALPTTFGLKAAGWLAPLLRQHDRFADLGDRIAVAQLGGAAGTLAPLGEHAAAVRRAFADELGLGLDAMPWHTQRDRIVELAGGLAGVAGSLGKMGQDLILLGQEEIAEVDEVGEAARGGSSTLPHKRNPIRSEMLVVSARACADLVGRVHHAMLQEHERGTSGWQLEWTALPELVGYASGSLATADALLADLRVDPARMRVNLDATGGVLLAERATFALAEHMPRAEAAQLVGYAAASARGDGASLIDVLADQTDAPVDWTSLRDPSTATGAAAAFVDAVLADYRGHAHGTPTSASPPKRDEP